VEAQTGDLWSMLRLGSAFGLAVSLLLLGLTFVPSKAPVRAREDDERARIEERQESDEGAVMEAEGQPPAEQLPAEERAPTSEEDVRALDADLDEAVDQVKALDGDGESLDADGESKESMPGWSEEFQDMFRDMAREGDSQTQEIRQRREEFKTRAKQAELRLKKQDAELHKAPSAPNAER
jgi:hypothetical protein